MTGRILIVDDDQSMCELLSDELGRRGHSVVWRTSAAEAFQDVMDTQFDTVLTDLRMPGLGGIQFCHRVVQNRPDLPVIVITAFGSLDSAVEAIRAGAYDFISKPVEADMLALVIERALKYRALGEQVRLLKQGEEAEGEFDEIIGNSPAMKRLFEQIGQIAELDVPVLITGESGTGKELVARALHGRSLRHKSPFVPVNCAALPEMLLESELFGHARGAFTDARSERQGLFMKADGGTLFLDEIAEIPLPMQPKLLRALETGSVRPVGEDEEVSCDVRLLAATNQSLERALEEQRFREDLFFRINVVRLEVPPLRDREDDVLLLAQHFLDVGARRSGKRVRGISPRAADRLLAYRWPGNVRELRNCMERAVAMTRFEELVVEDLPDPVRCYPQTQTTAGSGDPAQLLPLDEVERNHIAAVLEATQGNKSEAARILGLDRKTLYRKLERWNL